MSSLTKMMRTEDRLLRVSTHLRILIQLSVEDCKCECYFKILLITHAGFIHAPFMGVCNPVKFTQSIHVNTREKNSRTAGQIFVIFDI
jgi:hypothetical protein